MNKVTVAQFLNAGFEFVVGDEVKSSKGISCTVQVPDVWSDPKGSGNRAFIASLAPRENTGTQPVAGDCVVEVEYMNNYSRDTEIGAAGLFHRDCWKLEDISGIARIKSWKPSLKHLEQQMNDKKESAMNISERDIENAFIQQDDTAVESELVESGKWVNGDACLYHNGKEGVFIGLSALFPHVAVVEYMDGMEVRLDKLFVSDLSKPLTPEQLVAKERENGIDEMPCSIDPEALFWKLDSIKSSDEYRIAVKAVIATIIGSVKAEIYDAGYRKQ